MSTRTRTSARQKKIQENKQVNIVKEELKEDISAVTTVEKVELAIAVPNDEENSEECGNIKIKVEDEIKNELKSESETVNENADGDEDGDTNMNEKETSKNDAVTDVENNEREDHEDEKGETEEVTLTVEETEKAKEFNKIVSETNIDEISIDDILKLKIKLKDGSENFLFSQGPKYSEDKWPLNCHLCRLGNLFTEEHIRHHLKGKSHINKLINRLPIPKYYNEPFFTSVPKEFEKDKPIKIFAGEIIGEIDEENQDRVVKVEEFAAKEPTDKKLLRMLQKEHLHEYNSKMPLLGLCYIYKMMGFRGVTYYCTLCNTKIDEEAFQHIVGSEHQFKYINRHFPKLYERVNNALKEIRGIDTRFCVRNIFRKFYRKIENIKGLRKITICDDEDFFKHKKRYLLKTRFDEHYGEDSIILTDQEIDVLIRKCKNGMQFIKADLISLENPQLGYRMTYNDERAGEQIFDDMMGNRAGGFDNYGGGYGGGDVWNNYFQVLEREIEDLNREYRNFDRFPRKHPKYEGELNKYNTFKKDGGNDKDKKEFNIPWNTYWKRRLRVLYENELTKRKQRIKRQLNLRVNARTPSPPRRGGFNNFGLQGCYGGGGYGNNYGNNQAAVAGLRELMSMMNNQQGGGGGYGNNYNLLGGNFNRGGMSDLPPPPAPQPSQQNEPLGVISVLRLFNALESQLGSLGPQAVQLLSRAVIVEKNGQNPNDLMMERDFYIFFVTAREKLKGQYIANTIQTNLMSAAKNTIQDCTTLIEMFEDFCKRSGKKLPDATESNIPKTNTNQWKSDQGGHSSTFDNDDFFIGGNTGAYANNSNNDNRSFSNNSAPTYGYSTGGYVSGGYSTGGNNNGSGFNRNQSNPRWN